MNTDTTRHFRDLTVNTVFMSGTAYYWIDPANQVVDVNGVDIPAPMERDTPVKYVGYAETYNNARAIMDSDNEERLAAQD